MMMEGHYRRDLKSNGTITDSLIMRDICVIYLELIVIKVKFCDILPAKLRSVCRKCVES